MIDSHCHIAGPEFVDDLDQVVARADAAGVTRALVILAAEDRAEVERAPAVAASWSAVRFSVGVHPHSAKVFTDEPASVSACVRDVIASQPLTRALGEIGLDYHYDLSPREVQRDVFRHQIALARELRLPIVVHTREAEEDTFALLRETHAHEVGGVFHCFTGDRAMATRALELGFYISLSGIVTFPKAAELKEVARVVPDDRLLIETDSPFLSPVPHRGTRNEPGRVAEVARVVAELRGRDVAEISQMVRANYERLFGL